MHYCEVKRQLGVQRGLGYIYTDYCCVYYTTLAHAFATKVQSNENKKGINVHIVTYRSAFTPLSSDRNLTFLSKSSFSLRASKALSSPLLGHTIIIINLL